MKYIFTVKDEFLREQTTCEVDIPHGDMNEMLKLLQDEAYAMVSEYMVMLRTVVVLCNSGEPRYGRFTFVDSENIYLIVSYEVVQ